MSKARSQTQISSKFSTALVREVAVKNPEVAVAGKRRLDDGAGPCLVQCFHLIVGRDAEKDAWEVQPNSILIFLLREASKADCMNSTVA
jgi:hypothetical protein